MAENNKNIVAFLVGFLLLLLNVIYFLVYFSLMGLNFSWLSFVFVAGGTISFFFILQFLRSFLWQAVCLIALTLFFVWALANFAYFQVFNVFLDFGTGHLKNLNLSAVNLLQDFVTLIPTKLYLITGVIWLSFVVNVLWFFKMSKKEVNVLLFNSTILEVLERSKRRNFSQAMFWVVLFVIFNAGIFSATAYFVQNPKEEWWELSQQVSDLGVMGHLYTQVYIKTQSTESALESDLPLMQQTKQQYDNMAKLSEGTKAKFELPFFENKPNIIVLQLESISSWALDQDPSPMPFLRSLIDNNLVVEHFHANSCETNNAEFSGLCGFWPNTFEPINYSHQQNRFNCLPSILKQKYGYESYFFHANDADFWDRDVMLPKWGFENIFQVPFLGHKEKDESVLLKALDVFEKSKKPFLGYVVTYTSHAPHTQEQIDFQREQNGLEIVPYQGRLNPDYYNVEVDEETVRNYLGFMRGTDMGLESFFREFDKSSLKQNTVVVIYNDHRYYNFKGDSLDDFYHYNELPMVIVLPKPQKGVIQRLASLIDMAPTILNLIEQNNYQPQSGFSGTSLYSKEFPNMVLNKCLGQIYFLNNDLVVKGNGQTKMYNVFYADKKLTNMEKKLWPDLIKKLTELSDKTLYEDALVE